MVMAGIFVQFLFNASLPIQPLTIINLQPLKRKKKLHVKNRIVSLKIENALISFEAGVLLTALLSYPTVSKDFKFVQKQGCSLGPLGCFCLFWGVLSFFLQFFESGMNFAFVSRTKVTPESLFPGLMSCFAFALISKLLVSGTSI